ARGAGQGCGLELFQTRQGFVGDGIAIAFFGCQVEQRNGNTSVGEMGGDLRAHDARSQYGGVFDNELAAQSGLLFGQRQALPDSVMTIRTGWTPGSPGCSLCCDSRPRRGPWSEHYPR